jgi:hypothetical protein
MTPHSTPLLVPHTGARARVRSLSHQVLGRTPLIPRSYGRLSTRWITVALELGLAALAETSDAQTHPKLAGCGRMIPHELDPDGRQTDGPMQGLCMATTPHLGNDASDGPV